MKRRQKFVLGIDVGGSKVAAGLVDSRGRVSAYQSWPTSRQDLLKQLEQIIEGYDNFSGIGIGVPGQVLENGVVVFLPNIEKFKTINLKKFLTGKYRVPVVINNDAKCFAFAEAKLGVAKKYSRVVGVILGTGIGSGLVIEQKIFKGKDGLAGEFDHFLMFDGKTLREHVRSHGKFKNALAAKKYLKLLMSYVLLSYNPDAVVLGGAWSKLVGMKAVAQKAIDGVFKFKSPHTPIFISKLRAPGVIGAALPLLE